MRLGVIDVGSNTVHLLVVDAHPGAHPRPDWSQRVALRLAEHLTDDGLISEEGGQTLARLVVEGVEVAESRGVSQVMALATSAIRDAGNTEEVLARVAAQSGVDLQVPDGDDEARVTFLAVRRWFGRSASRSLMIDIGGPVRRPSPAQAGPPADRGRPAPAGHPARPHHRRAAGGASGGLRRPRPPAAGRCAGGGVGHGAARHRVPLRGSVGPARGSAPSIPGRTAR